MDSQSPAVVVLFRGDPRREERQKQLPRQFLSTLHAALLKTIGEVADLDVLIARDDGDDFRLGDGRWQLDSLAERVEAATAYAFSRGYSRVLLLAGDVVDVRREDIAHAFRALDGTARTAAIGFSRDGGFYAAGFSRPPGLDWRRLLEDRSKSGALLSEALRADGFLVEELPPVDDVDDRADAERLVHLRRGSRALLRLIAKLTSILQLLTAAATRPHLRGEVAFAFSSPFRGPPGSRRLS